MHFFNKSPGAVKVLKIVTVLLCLILLCLPLIQSNFSVFTITPLTENRLKAAKPKDPLTLLTIDTSYAIQYEKYFNDTFGFRDLLIRLKNQFDYSIFGFSRQVIIGKDGWIFYKNVLEDATVNIERASENGALEKLFGRIIRLNGLLASRGIRLILIPCPMKTTMNPEYLPEHYLPLPSPSAFQRYRDFLHQHPEILTIDAQAELEELKKTRPVYHKTDFHWNDPAGAHVLLRLLSVIATSAGLPQGTVPPIKVKIDNSVGGGEINSLAVVWPPYENMLMLEAPLFTANGSMTVSARPNEWTYISNDPGAKNLLPATVLFGDSFSDAFLRAGFAARFTRIEKFYNLEFEADFNRIPEGTRFLILEHIETNLGPMLTDAYWPEELR